MITKEAILERLFKSPIVQDEIRAAEQEMQAQREHHAEVLAVNQAEAAKTLPKLAKATGDARAKLAAARQAVAELQRAFQIAEIAELDAHNRLERAMSQSRDILFETAPECVSRYLREMVAHYGVIRHSALVDADINGAEVPGSMTGGHEQRKQLHARWERAQKVREYHQLVRDVIDDLKGMFLVAIAPDEAAKEIARYRAAIDKARVAAGILLN